MQLQPWSYQSAQGFELRGWHSQPTGRPLLHFIHGNGFCGLTYRPLLALLSEHFDLWLSDVQGHGDSAAGERFYGWNQAASLALEAFVDHGLFATVPRYAVGHSFGGVLSALMASEGAGVFHALVMLDPVIFTRKILYLKSLLALVGQTERLPMVHAARRRRDRWATREQACFALHERGIYKGWRLDAYQAFIAHALKDLPDGGVALKCPTWLEADIFATSPSKLWPSLKAIRVPTLVMYGDQTYPFVEQAAMRFKAQNSVVSLLKTSGGHCFMQQDPEHTAHAVRRFLMAL